MKLYLPGAGNKVYHIKNFKEVKDVSKVIISDIYEWVYGNFVADSAYLLPKFDDHNYLSAFEQMYDKEQFDYCIPINDSSLLLFSRERERFKAYPFKLAINSSEVIDIVSDKIATRDFFISHGIPTPMTYTVNDFLNITSYDFPYFLKPRYINIRGTERQLYIKIEDYRDLEYALHKMKDQEDYIIQHYVSGSEYNIDIFCDAMGELRSVVVLKRTGMGITRGISRGEIIIDHPFENCIIKITKELGLYGMNQVQAYITNENEILYMEINGRFSGSSVFVKEAGVNYFYYFIELLKGNSLEIKEVPIPLKMTSWEKPYYYESNNIIRM